MSALPTLRNIYFRHCRIFFCVYTARMTFQHDISRFTAAQIIETLGCPRGTAYDWLDGRRAPPEWQQPHWLAILKANPTRQPMTARGKSKKKAK